MPSLTGPTRVTILLFAQYAEAVGRSRAAVSNLLRILDLPDDVLDMLAEGTLTEIPEKPPQGGVPGGPELD